MMIVRNGKRIIARICVAQTVASSRACRVDLGAVEPLFGVAKFAVDRNPSLDLVFLDLFWGEHGEDALARARGSSDMKTEADAYRKRGRRLHGIDGTRAHGRTARAPSVRPFAAAHQDRRAAPRLVHFFFSMLSSSSGSRCSISATAASRHRRRAAASVIAAEN